jgi:hypothetical protein
MTGVTLRDRVVVTTTRESPRAVVLVTRRE